MAEAKRYAGFAVVAGLIAFPFLIAYRAWKRKEVIAARIDGIGYEEVKG